MVTFQKNCWFCMGILKMDIFKYIKMSKIEKSFSNLIQKSEIIGSLSCFNKYIFLREYTDFYTISQIERH